MHPMNSTFFPTPAPPSKAELARRAWANKLRADARLARQRIEHGLPPDGNVTPQGQLYGDQKHEIALKHAGKRIAELVEILAERAASHRAADLPDELGKLAVDRAVADFATMVMEPGQIDRSVAHDAVQAWAHDAGDLASDPTIRAIAAERRLAEGT